VIRSARNSPWKHPPLFRIWRYSLPSQEKGNEIVAQRNGIVRCFAFHVSYDTQYCSRTYAALLGLISRASKRSPAKRSQLRRTPVFANELRRPSFPYFCGVKLDIHERERMSETGGIHIQVARSPARARGIFGLGRMRLFRKSNWQPKACVSANCLETFFKQGSCNFPEE
jgi:hypothetical protein